MRVVWAGLFVFGVLMLAVALFSAWIEEKSSESIIGPLIILIGGLATGGAYFLFNKAEDRWPGLSVEQMEARGLLDLTSYRAKRAFGVLEFEEDAPHYFIELEAGDVLHLYGEYLFDYEPWNDEPEWSQPRQFPCSMFTIKRGVRDGYVVFIQVGGDVLEPEAMPVLSPESLKSEDAWPEDGAILPDAPYETLKHRFLLAS